MSVERERARELLHQFIRRRGDTEMDVLTQYPIFFGCVMMAVQTYAITTGEAEDYCRRYLPGTKSADWQRMLDEARPRTGLWPWQSWS